MVWAWKRIEYDAALRRTLRIFKLRLQRGPCVPFPLLRIFHKVKDSEVVPPPNLSNNLLDK
jgi:hypothetical protein